MLPKSLSAPHVALLTLGCAKNDADSRAMQKQLESRGFLVSTQAENADFIILNTCAFIEAAIEESLDTILELAALERVQRGEARLLVAGCLPSRFGDDLASELPEVTALVPVAQEAEIVEVLEDLCKNMPLAFSQDSGRGIVLPTPGIQPWAYVKISDGCSRHCSYCTIPSIRGPYYNYSFETISAEIDSLVAQGVREIILIGQDTGLWCNPQTQTGLQAETQTETADEKATQPAPQNLAELLDVLAVTYPKTWFRVMYLQPEGVSDELLAVMGTHSNIASYLDIPLQHASAQILASMNRKGSGEEYLKLVHHLRDVLPELTLRTTVIVGFPGETQEDFDELYEFIAAARLNYVGIFAYSREEGTAAALLPNQIDEETTLERLQALRDLADTIGFELTEEQLGQEEEVLICGRDEEGLFGRTRGQAPEVDGITSIVNTEIGNSVGQGTLKSGDVVRVRVSEAVLYDIGAELVAEV